MSTDDAEIEAAAKRAYEAFVGPDPVVSWEGQWSLVRDAWFAVARAAQPLPKLCGTCQHWGYGKDDRPNRECAKIIGMYPSTYDALSVNDFDGAAVIIETDAACCCFETKADFGCVLHEPMEEKTDA